MRIIARICRRTQAANWFVEGPLTAWIRVTTADYWFEFVKPLLDLIKNILATFSFNYRVFIKYCFFFEDFKIYSGLWPLSVSPRFSVCTQWQVKHQRCSRKITTFNEHPIRSNSKIATDVRDSTSTSATNEYRSCNYWLYLNR